MLESTGYDVGVAGTTLWWSIVPPSVIVERIFHHLGLNRGLKPIRLAFQVAGDIAGPKETAHRRSRSVG